jgi:hypothetical protein
MQYGDRMKFIYFIILFILFGCSSSTYYAGGKGIENSIRKSVVKSYTNNEVWELRAKQLGYVEAQHCQVDFRENIPSKKSFISSLKVKTQKLGGNGLVFDSCIVSRNASCNTHTLCRGSAYIVTYE